MCSFLLAVVAKMLLALGSAKAALALCLLGVLTTEHPADSTTAATTVTDWTDEPRDTETVARFDPTEDQELAGAREVDTTEPPPDTEAGKGTTVVETPEAKAAREKEAAGKDKTDEAETTGDLVSDFYLKGVKPPADTATPSTTTDPFTPLSAKIKKVGPERVAAALVEAGFDKAEAEALVNAPTGAGKLAVEVGELRKSSDTVKKAQTALATFVTFDDKGELASFDGNNVFLTACKALGVKKVVEDFSQGTDYTIVPKAYLASLQAGGANGNGQAARATAALEVAKALKLDERLKETGAEIDLATATAQQVRDLVHQFGDAEDQYLDRVEALKREQATAGDRQAAAERSTAAGYVVCDMRSAMIHPGFEIFTDEGWKPGAGVVDYEGLFRYRPE